MAANPHLDIVEGADGGWRFQITTTPGDVIVTSEPYATKYQAERGADTARRLLGVGEPVRAAVALGDALGDLASSWEQASRPRQQAARHLRRLLETHGPADVTPTR